MSKKRLNAILFCLIVSLFLNVFSVAAAQLDVSVGFDGVIYEVGESVTISGKVRNLSESAISGADVWIAPKYPNGTWF